MTSGQAASAGAGTEWYDYVSLSGEEGRRWVAEYRTSPYAVVPELAQKSLALLRAHEIAAGREILSQIENHLRHIPSAPRSILHVLERWLYGTVGYYHYVVEDYEAAEKALDRAHEVITAAISLSPFLLPLANHCPEFVLHRARISRSRRRWDEMRRDIGLARRMTENQFPLCTLSDGRAIDYRCLGEYYLAISALNEGQRETVHGLLNDEVRLRRFERFVAAIYALPGFVIPYP
jgi:hypothetical protein